MARRANVNKGVIKQSRFSLAKKVKAISEEFFSIVRRVVVYFEDPQSEEIFQWRRDNQRHVERVRDETLHSIKQHLVEQGLCETVDCSRAYEIATKIVSHMFNLARVEVLRNSTSLRDDQFPELSDEDIAFDMLGSQQNFLKRVLERVWNQNTMLNLERNYAAGAQNTLNGLACCEIEAEHWHCDLWENWRDSFCKTPSSLEGILWSPEVQQFIFQLTHTYVSSYSIPDALYYHNNGYGNLPLNQRFNTLPMELPGFQDRFPTWYLSNANQGTTWYTPQWFADNPGIVATNTMDGGLENVQSTPFPEPEVNYASPQPWPTTSAAATSGSGSQRSFETMQHSGCSNVSLDQCVDPQQLQLQAGKDQFDFGGLLTDEEVPPTQEIFRESQPRLEDEQIRYDDLLPLFNCELSDFEQPEY